MEHAATSVKGSLILRGVLAILFGIAAVFWPGITLVTLVYLFGAFVLINGLVDLVIAISRLASRTVSSMNNWLILLLGILQIGVGVYLFRHPEVSFATLILLVGFTLIVRGVFEMVDGFLEKGSALYKTISIIGGVIAVIAGIVVLFQPVAGGVAFVWILGIYALITGPMMIALAMDVDRLEKK